MQPVISVTKQRVEDIPQPKKRSARLMKKAIASQEEAKKNWTNEELKDGLDADRTSSEDEETKDDDSDYVPGD